jgi:hypothetical protein
MNPLRNKQDPAADPSPDRPPIWVTGRQRPSFDLRAYGAYSLIATRAALGPGLVRLAGRTSKFQDRVASGAFAMNTARFGKAASYLPTRAGIAASIGGLSGLMQDAAAIVVPIPAVPESLAAYDALWRSRPVPASGRLRGVDFDKAQRDPALDALRHDAPLRPRRLLRDVTPPDSLPDPSPLVPTGLHEAPAPAPVAPVVVPAVTPPAGAESDPLFAIRTLMAEAEPVEPISRPKPTLVPKAAERHDIPQSSAPPDRPRKPLPAWTKPALRLARSTSVVALAWGLTAVAMPIGLVKAGIAHLDGRDLRDLVEDR